MTRLYVNPKTGVVSERVIIPWGLVADTIFKLAAGWGVLLLVFG